MKKTLSVLLAMLMLVSCFSVFTAGAADGDIADMIYSPETIAEAESALSYFNVKNLPEQINDFDQFRKSSAWNSVSLLGISLDFLYSGNGSLRWSELDVLAKDENGNLVFGADGLPVNLITKDDISLAFTNIALYLQRVFYNNYGGLNLYTVDNAIAFANIIGKIFFPDFAELNPDNFRNYFTNEVPSANEFFRAVATLSGIDVIVENNWLTRARGYYQPVINLLGGNYINFLEDYYSDGLLLSSKILEGMIKKLIAVGPFDYAFDIITLLASDAYNFTYREPILALFTHKIPVMSNYMSETELKSFDGLLQLIFCEPDCYSSSVRSVAAFCPFDFPTERFMSTTDRNELIIYLYYYLNLCGRYKNNREYFTNMKNDIMISTSIAQEDKIKLEALVDGLFLGNFNVAVKDAIIPLYKENISTASTNLFDRFRNAFMTFLKKIADYFDYLRRIFNGELDYGQGNSPFN